MEDTLSGPLVLVDAMISPDGATCWLTDGPINYVRSGGRTWMVADFPAYRAAYPALSSAWLVEPHYQRQQSCGRLTMPGDGLLTASGR